MDIILVVDIDACLRIAYGDMFDVVEFGDLFENGFDRAGALDSDAGRNRQPVMRLAGQNIAQIKTALAHRTEYAFERTFVIGNDQVKVELHAEASII